MKETEIRKYAALMKELDLTGLEITEDNQVVRLERSLSAPAATTVQTIVSADAAASISDSAPADDYISVKSPLVGVFYATPAENAEPYIAIGDRVQKGSVLCIVESMKLMNEICAEQDGVIAEICATNGQVVEYGTELFRIKR